MPPPFSVKEGDNNLTKKINVLCLLLVVYMCSIVGAWFGKIILRPYKSTSTAPHWPSEVGSFTISGLIYMLCCVFSLILYNCFVLCVAGFLQVHLIQLQLFEYRYLNVFDNSLMRFRFQVYKQEHRQCRSELPGLIQGGFF